MSRANAVDIEAVAKAPAAKTSNERVRKRFTCFSIGYAEVRAAPVVVPHHRATALTLTLFRHTQARSKWHELLTCPEPWPQSLKLLSQAGSLPERCRRYH